MNSKYSWQQIEICRDETYAIYVCKSTFACGYMCIVYKTRIEVGFMFSGFVVSFFLPKRKKNCRISSENITHYENASTERYRKKSLHIFLLSWTIPKYDCSSLSLSVGEYLSVHISV